jgi:hypothetical protein
MADGGEPSLSNITGEAIRADGHFLAPAAPANAAVDP